MNILITGANGQLGRTLQILSQSIKDTFYFFSHQDIDITHSQAVEKIFNQYHFDCCVNCAAYTAVDKAESEISAAHNANVKGAANLAKYCHLYNTALIHISTDFVFDGSKNLPYTESDSTNPLSVYGKTKLEGEQAILETCSNALIIRTSWLYSGFGNNFLSAMLKFSKEKKKIGVVSDQLGSPTYAHDLAEAILHIIQVANIKKKGIFGIYHYSNEGVASWYDFAATIFEYMQIDIKLLSISTKAFRRPATRPHFSVMNKTKIKETFNITIPYWRDSLKKCLYQYFFTPKK